jgi:L-iditol 2-dehydrogenase
LKQDPVKKVQEITAGRMADLVMDVTGRPEGAIAAIDMVRKGGTVILPGLYGTTTQVPLLLDKVVLKEIRLQGVYRSSRVFYEDGRQFAVCRTHCRISHFRNWRPP